MLSSILYKKIGKHDFYAAIDKHRRQVSDAANDPDGVVDRGGPFAAVAR